MTDKIGIYVHLPFCESKCAYCDFNSYAGMSQKQQEYIGALIKEIKSYSSRVKGRMVDTIYIGGGTPSTIFSGAIQTILAEIKKSYIIEENAEISIEANPNSITMSKALEWRESGINRVSVGLQTTNRSALKAIGRIHTKVDYINAIKLLQDAGFKNINTDLMIGLPKQKSSDVRYAIKLVHKLGCTHVSCYSLILEEGTPLYHAVKLNNIKLPKETKVIGMYNTAFSHLTKLGYKRYEVSNFAYSGYECRHNLNCWNMHEYLGFGAGAHGYIDGVRYNNVLGIDEYIRCVMERVDPVSDRVNSTVSDEYEECIMLGLRTTDGVLISRLDNLLGESFVDRYKPVIDKYRQLNLIELDDRIRVTDRGFFVLNQIILDFVM